MITLVAKKIVKKAYLDEFIELANKLAEESRKENGCEEYHLYQDIDNPQVLTFIEKWVDEKAIQDHKQTEHYNTIMPKLKAFEEMLMEISLYKVII